MPTTTPRHEHAAKATFGLPENPAASRADEERAQVRRTEEMPTCPSCMQPVRALANCHTCACITCHKCCRECPSHGERVQ